MSLLIAGYPYIKEEYFKTFDSYPGAAYFLLPKTWKAKGGKLTFKSPERNNVFTTKALFYHSNYPVVGGALKGWMPFFPFYIFKAKDLKLVFSPSEPILLTTLYQGFWTKLFGKKHVVFSWENISYSKKLRGLKGLFHKLILRLNLYFCDAVVCGNKKGAEIFKDLTKKPVKVIPLSGVDTNFFNRITFDRKFKDIDLSGKVVFSFAGALGYRKGIHLIIESMIEVIKEVPNTHLIIAGSGEYEQNIRAKIESSGLSKQINLISWLGRAELKELLLVSDIFLYPSISFGGWEEQFGYSMAEASLMGVPVISTQVGSIEEVVKNGVTGILIEPGRADQLKNAMIKLAQNEDMRRTMGQAGRRYVVENFSYQAVADKFYKLFNEIGLHS